MEWTKAGKWLTTIAAALTLAACGGSEEVTEDATSEGTATEETSGNFDTTGTINVVSREDGSGTRDAFIEITGVLGDDDVDNTYVEASIQSSTGAVMSTVSGDSNAIGYISLGSLDDSVRAVNVEGVEASSEEIQSGNYAIYRPFNVAYFGELSAEAQDFWNFVFSPEAQEIVTSEGYIAISEDQQVAYEGNADASGSITVGGSTSVTGVMEAIVDAYNQNQAGDVTVEIISNGSGAGMTGAIDGTNDIGMASRELSEDESSQLESAPMALDGIAVVVHNDNPLEDLTVEQVRQIFTGEVTTWDEVM